MAKVILVQKLPIQLDQFLKLAGAVSSCGEVKMLMEEDRILKNGERESARRRILSEGDRIDVEGIGSYEVGRGAEPGHSYF